MEPRLDTNIEEAFIEGEVMERTTEITSTRTTVDEFVVWISESWRSSMEGILETGRRLLEAKKVIKHGLFVEMIGSQLPFGDRTAQKIMKIAECPKFSNPSPETDLPHSWTVLYEMIGLSGQEFKKLIDTGLINKNTTRNEIIEIKKELRNPSKPTKASGTREVNQPPQYSLRLTHGEVLLLREAFGKANELGILDKWIKTHFPNSRKGSPDPKQIFNKFDGLNLPSLPTVVGTKG